MKIRKKKWLVIIGFLICYIIIEGILFLMTCQCGMPGSTCGLLEELELLFYAFGIIGPILLITYLIVKK